MEAISTFPPAFSFKLSCSVCGAVHQSGPDRVGGWAESLSACADLAELDRPAGVD